MNPLRYPLRAQAKAIAAALGALSTGLVASELSPMGLVVSLIGATATFYGVFAASNDQG